MNTEFTIKLNLPRDMTAEVIPSGTEGRFIITVFNADGSLHDSFNWLPHGDNGHVSTGPGQMWAIGALQKVLQAFKD